MAEFRLVSKKRGRKEHCSLLLSLTHKRPKLRTGRASGPGLDNPRNTCLWATSVSHEVGGRRMPDVRSGGPASCARSERQGINKNHLRFSHCRAPERGVLFGASMQTSEFFRDEAKRCRDSAERASRKDDREFWLNLARRWETLLQARERETPNVEVRRVEHPYLRKPNRAA